MPISSPHVGFDAQAAAHLSSDLPLRAQLWIAQQAQTVVRLGKFGPAEQTRLELAIRSKIGLVSGGSGVAAQEAAVSLVTFLVLSRVLPNGSETIQDLESKLQTVGDDAQLANVDMQNALQKQQQTLQMVSTISKLVSDTAMSIIGKIGPP